MIVICYTTPVKFSSPLRLSYGSHVLQNCHHVSVFFGNGRFCNQLFLGVRSPDGKELLFVRTQKRKSGKQTEFVATEVFRCCGFFATSPPQSLRIPRRATLERGMRHEALVHFLERPRGALLPQCRLRRRTGLGGLSAGRLP